MTDLINNFASPYGWLGLIAIGILGGLISGLVGAGVMHLLGADPDPAVVGGFAGAVAGGLMPLILRGCSDSRAD